MSNQSTRPPPAVLHDASAPVPGTAPRDCEPSGTAPADQRSACSCELDTEPGPVEPIVVLRVAGAVDMLTLPVLQRALTVAADRRAGDLVIDLSAVTFCCVRGFGLLATTAATARNYGTAYAVSGLSWHLNRIADLLWPEPPCVRYRSTAAAVTAIRTRTDLPAHLIRFTRRSRPSE